MDWYLEVRIQARDRQYSFCLLRASRSCKDWLHYTTSCTILAQCLEETSRPGIWVDMVLAIPKWLTFFQTRSNAIIHQGTLPAYCILKVERLKTGEVLFERPYLSPRPPPKISLRHNHDWTRGNDELGSTVEQQPEGKVVRQSRGEVQHATFSQLTQPIPKPICDRSGKPDSTEDVFVVEGETSRSHKIDDKGLHEELGSSDRSGQPEITPSVIEACNLSKNTRVQQTHDGSGQLGERDCSCAHSVLEQHALEVHREVASLTRTTSSIVQSTRRTLTSTFQAYRILQWSNCIVPAFENWLRKSKTPESTRSSTRPTTKSII